MTNPQTDADNIVIVSRDCGLCSLKEKTLAESDLQKLLNTGITWAKLDELSTPEKANHVWNEPGNWKEVSSAAGHDDQVGE